MKIGILLLVSLFNICWVTMTNSSATLGALVPLLPIAAITGHTGLLTSGLAGAGLLKLKAAATIAAFLSLRRKRHHSTFVETGYGWSNHGHGGGYSGGHGQHGHGHGHGHGYGGSSVHGGYHRRRRAAESNDGRGETLESTDLKDYDPSLDEVLQYDQLGCGMRLVCELSATPEKSLFDDEKLILELFGRDEKAPNPNRASRGKLSYTYAALLGSHAKDSEVCSRVYGRCPYSGQQVMQSLRDANI